MKTTIFAAACLAASGVCVPVPDTNIEVALPQPALPKNLPGLPGNKPSNASPSASKSTPSSTPSPKSSPASKPNVPGADKLTGLSKNLPTKDLLNKAPGLGNLGSLTDKLSKLKGATNSVGGVTDSVGGATGGATKSLGGVANRVQGVAKGVPGLGDVLGGKNGTRQSPAAAGTPPSVPGSSSGNGASITNTQSEKGILPNIAGVELNKELTPQIIKLLPPQAVEKLLNAVLAAL